MEFQVRYLTLFLLFSVIDSFKWFWMESLHKNIQLMLEFLKAPFLVLHFSYYTLMTFLMMLSVILPSMLMILLSILSVIRHLIFGNNLSWLLNVNLTYETLNWHKKWLVDFNAGKTQLVLFTWSNNTGSLYLSKSPYARMEYCCHVWASYYLELLDKLQKRICRTLGPSLAASLEQLAHC